jgi:TATA-binding protein-associated factor Taf7
MNSFDRSRITVLEHEVNQLMEWRKRMAATLADITNDIVALKARTDAFVSALNDVKAQLAAALARPTVDPAEVQAAHDALSGVISEMDAANPPA